MPGISAKLEMVLSNDSTKFEPFLYGKKNGAGSQKIGHFGPSMTACTKQNIFQTPCTIFLHYKNGSNLVESLLSIIPIYAEFPGIFDF